MIADEVEQVVRMQKSRERVCQMGGWNVGLGRWREGQRLGSRGQQGRQTPDLAALLEQWFVRE